MSDVENGEDGNGESEGMAEEEKFRERGDERSALCFP